MYRSSAVRISPAGNASGSWQLGRNPLSWHRRQSNTRFLFVCLSFSSGANHPLGPPSSPLSTSSSCVSTLRCTVRGTRTFWHRLHSRLNPLRFLQATVWRLAALSFKSRERADSAHLLHAIIFWISFQFCCDSKHKHPQRRCSGCREDNSCPLLFNQSPLLNCQCVHHACE